MNYGDWKREEAREAIKADRMWRVEAYRLALFAKDVGWRDATKLTQDHRARGRRDS